ncbi:MAG: glycosyltransferase family 2 protein [Akkermansia sp.]|nr:glycosyltransferase family 2 protein [Akkermansia sp.]
MIPIINEGERIAHQLERARVARIHDVVDIVICDGGSTDGSVECDALKKMHINTLLIKKGAGKQGAQLRMGFFWALQRGYDDGNNKDSIESIPLFIQKLEQGYDFVQGSRFIRGGIAINTPLIRYIAVRLIHAPVISHTARFWFTDTTNAFRAYSLRYLKDPRVKVFRDNFVSYELLAYLSVRATQLGYSACEVPVTRAYPPVGKTPTKISFFKGNWELMKTLFLNWMGRYNP